MLERNAPAALQDEETNERPQREHRVAFQIQAQAQLLHDTACIRSDGLLSSVETAALVLDVRHDGSLILVLELREHFAVRETPRCNCEQDQACHDKMLTYCWQMTRKKVSEQRFCGPSATGAMQSKKD